MKQTFRYGDASSQSGDLHLPAAGDRWPVVSLLHGGFWRTPYGREQMELVAVDLAARGYAAWNIGYRRIGERGGGWPGTLEDVGSAIDHLSTLAIHEGRLDLGRVAVVGHSAGGQLALCVGARSTAVRRFAPLKVYPAAVCGLAAVSDLEGAFALGSGNDAARTLMEGSPDEHPDRYAQASPRKLLPLGVRQLLIHGLLDDAVPLELSRTYVRAARDAGERVDYIELPGTGHMQYLDTASEAHARLCAWLEAALDSGTSN